MHRIVRLCLVLIFCMSLLATACKKERDPLRDAERAVGQQFYEKAAPLLRKKLKEDPKNKKAKELLITTLMGLEEYSEVRSILEEMIKAEPKNDSYKHLLGEALLEQIKLQHRTGSYTTNKDGYERRIIRALSLAHPRLQPEIVQYLAGFYDEEFETISTASDRSTAVPAFKKALYAKAESPEIAPFIPPTEPLLSQEFRSRINSTIRKIAREEKEKLEKEKLAGYQSALEAVATDKDAFVDFLNTETIARNQKIVTSFSQKKPTPTFPDLISLVSVLDAPLDKAQVSFEGDRITFMLRHPLPLVETSVADYNTIFNTPPDQQNPLAITDAVKASSRTTRLAMETAKEDAKKKASHIISAVIPRMLEGIDAMRQNVNTKAIQTLSVESSVFIDYTPPEGITFPEMPATAPKLKQIQLTISVSKEEVVSLAMDYELFHKQGLGIDEDAEKKKDEEQKKKLEEEEKKKLEEEKKAPKDGKPAAPASK